MEQQTAIHEILTSIVVAVVLYMAFIWLCNIGKEKPRKNGKTIRMD